MAIDNKTYNNAINTLKNIGDNHLQIKTTTTGDIFEVNLEKNELFPIMHINPVNVTTGQSELNFNFQIFVMDLVSEDNNWTQTNIQSANNLSNEQEVLSETLSICTDIIGALRHGVMQSMVGVNDINQPIYFLDGEMTLEPFNERFDNLVTGFVFNITLTTMNDFQTCNIPMLNRGTGE
jgi:hypothetical protein